jgi:proteasome assembly chaperone (PAC2) family protein
VTDPDRQPANQPASGKQDELEEPVLVAAFEGWNDAGDAASAAIEHLQLTWEATELAELDPDDYYDFQVTRPTVRMVDGVTRRVEWPTTRMSVCRPPGASRDVVLMHGIEPNMRWRRFCAELLEHVDRLGVTTVVTLGALLADTPHTRPIPVSVSTGNRELMKQLGLAPSTYEGPTGIIGVLGDTLGRAGVEVLSLWSAIPHYVSHPPCPKATLALLTQLERVLDISLDLGELTELARAWERGVNELAAEDSEVAEYVASLEQMQDATELPEASGDVIAAEFERYLRRRQG